VVAPAADADTRTKMLAASEYTERKEYSMAEDIYKQVLKTEPKNVEALKALASVLYREDKIEESAAILDKLPKTN
jgi:thioredoxin-like negative regulator of GroEL